MDGDHLTVNRGKEEARERERKVSRKMARRRNEFPIRFLGISDEFIFFFSVVQDAAGNYDGCLERMID